jgi:hypothetical protein
MTQLRFKPVEPKLVPLLDVHIPFHAPVQAYWRLTDDGRQTLSGTLAALEFFKLLSHPWFIQTPRLAPNRAEKRDSIQSARIHITHRAIFVSALWFQRQLTPDNIDVIMTLSS